MFGLPLQNQKDNLVSLNAVKAKEDETLIVLCDMGYDTGRYSHVKVQFGIVDVRTVKSDVDIDDENNEGYQRNLTPKRILDITNDFHYSRLNPITICLRKNENGTLDRYNVDGQARVSSVRILYKKGELSSPMIPCVILSNTTKEDEAMLFGSQDDGTTTLRAAQKAKSLYIGKEEKICSLSNTLKECGIDLFKDVQAHKTIQDLFDGCNVDNFKRVATAINKSWLNGTKAQKKNATCAEIFTGLKIFYDKYADSIDDKYFIKKLSMTTPNAVRELFENYSNKLDPDRKFLKTFAEIYNKSKRSENRIDYL